MGVQRGRSLAVESLQLEFRQTLFTLDGRDQFLRIGLQFLVVVDLNGRILVVA
jgi:hypothetical protein